MTNLTFRNRRYRRGVYVDNKKLHVNSLKYIGVIAERDLLIDPTEKMTTRLVTDYVGKSQSCGEILKSLEQRGLIRNDGTEYRMNDWHITDFGAYIWERIVKRSGPIPEIEKLNRELVLALSEPFPEYEQV